MKIVKTAGFIRMAAWGKAGAGILFTCREDGTAMLLMRSGSVLDPYMWGVPGGAVKGTEGHYDDDDSADANEFSDEQLWDTARGETVQELYGVDEHDFDSSDQYFPQQYSRHPEKVIFDTNPANPNSFKYYTYVVDIPLAEKQKIEQRATLNWENDEMKWMPISELMSHVTPVGGGHARLNDGSKLHKGVSHVLKTHPSFQQAPTQPMPTKKPARPKKPKPVDPNQGNLF